MEQDKRGVVTEASRYRIRQIGYAFQNPHRVIVMKESDAVIAAGGKRAKKPWLVYRGLQQINSYKTHERAINFAQKIARSFEYEKAL